ncbi:hypothetical protein BDF14DRAFT_1879387 [Spinellus fusiger]|nr:hypothetical protein BDF14DRAFT_1879387 [Spinellus fusiger]
MSVPLEDPLDYLIGNIFDQNQEKDIVYSLESPVHLDDKLFFDLLSMSMPDLTWSCPKAPEMLSPTTRTGYCQHPKHTYYRQHGINPFLLPSTPRRGRPPKGTKEYPRLELSAILMTVRPLPKRLEPVVGLFNIRVCLTCLKRSDLDEEYLCHPLYIGPQTSSKRTKRPHHCS